MTPVFTTREHG